MTVFDRCLLSALVRKDYDVDGYRTLLAHKLNQKPYMSKEAIVTGKLETAVMHIFNWSKIKVYIYLNISVIHSTTYRYKYSSTVNK
jgi:hypothetical protein